MPVYTKQEALEALQQVADATDPNMHLIFAPKRSASAFLDDDHTPLIMMDQLWTLVTKTTKAGEGGVWDPMHMVQDLLPCEVMVTILGYTDGVDAHQKLTHWQLLQCLDWNEW